MERIASRATSKKSLLALFMTVALSLCLGMGVVGCASTTADIADEATPMASGTAGDLVVTGGTEGVDWAYEQVNYQRKSNGNTTTVGNAATPMLVIKTSTPLTISNASGKATSATGIRIDAGVDAYLTFDGVKIQSDVPCDIVTNSANPGTTTKTLKGNPTKLHLTLADGSENQLLANAGAHAPGLRCGEGSELYIDDAVPNVDVNGKSITPANGFIPAGTKYVGQDGKTYTASGSGADSSLANLESRNPGKLKCVAGYRAAGIGSGAWENAGKMTFDGGIFEVRAWTKTGDNRNDNSGLGSDWDYGCGAGIGGSYGGGGTEMYFNGGQFDVYGSYHGAAIGGGMYAYNTNSSPGDWNYRSYPFADAIRSGLSPNSSATDNTKTVPGNITINGGFIKARGGLHGNAFGQACGSWAKGCTILVTGGTLLPNSYGSLKMIGGDQGYVVITGGSVNCDKSKFGGIGDTAWGVLNGYSNANNKVFMTTIDLSADGWVNHTITNFGLTVNGEEFDYGAPSRFDNGKLYLWLPSTAVGKEVRVSLTGEKVEADGTVTQETPADLYIPSVTTDGSAKLKRYIDFKLPEDWRKQHWYKDYNGLPFEGYDFEGNGPIMTDENPPKQLSNAGNVTYKYQYCDDEGNPEGAEITVDATHPMPVDASKFTITMTSTQYSSQAGFKESYWGHRAYGEAEIRPVASRIPTLKAKWYDASGNLIEDENHKAKATDRLLITAQVTSGKNTAATCKAPTGKLELMVDGKVVETFDISKAGGTNATGKVEIKTYDDGREYVQFTYEAKASEKDYLLPNFQNDNKHEVTMNYVAAKNYLDVMAAEDPEAPKASVVVEPVDPEAGVKAGEGMEVSEGGNGDGDGDDGNGTGGGSGTPGLSADGTTFEKEYGLTYTFKKLEGGAKANTVSFEISSPSSGAFEVAQPDDEAIASGVQVVQKKDADGNPVKDKHGNFVYEVTLDVTSVGDTAFELTQKPNGAFYGTNFVIDLTVNPNPGIAPEPTLSKKAENVTHPNGAVQAGDRIKYTIAAGNAAPGSIWWFPKITDALPSSVELDPATLHVVNDSEGIDKALGAGEYTYAGGVLKVGAGVLSRVYGLHEAVLEFECVVKDEVGLRDASDDIKTVANEASATGYAGIDLPEGDEPEPKDPDDPKTPASEKPKGATPSNPDPTGPVAPENPKVLPKDPRAAEVSIAKEAQNLDRLTGTSEVGDTVQYVITLKNDTAGSCWYRAAFLDTLPKGVAFVPGSAKLTTPTGVEMDLSDAVYDEATNRLGVALGDIYGGEEAVLSFKGVITEVKEGQDLGNVAHAVGTLPSQLDKPKGVTPGGNGEGGNGGDGSGPSDSENPDGTTPGDGTGAGEGSDPTNPDEGGLGDGISSGPGDGSEPTDPADPWEVPGEPGAPYLPPDDVFLDVIANGGLPVDPDDPEGAKSTPQNPEAAYPLPDDKPVEPEVTDNGGTITGQVPGGNEGTDKGGPADGDTNDNGNAGNGGGNGGGAAAGATPKADKDNVGQGGNGNGQGSDKVKKPGTIKGDGGKNDADGDAAAGNGAGGADDESDGGDGTIVTTLRNALKLAQTGDALPLAALAVVAVAAVAALVVAATRRKRREDEDA